MKSRRTLAQAEELARSKLGAAGGQVRWYDSKKTRVILSAAEAERWA